MKKITVLLLAPVFTFVTISASAQKIADTEIKKNVTSIETALQKIIKLEPKAFEYDTNKYKHLALKPGKQYGFMAEDLMAVFPELVKEKSQQYMFGKNAYRNTFVKTIDAESLIPVLVASIQEQQRQIEELKGMVEELKNKKTVAAN